MSSLCRHTYQISHAFALSKNVNQNFTVFWFRCFHIKNSIKFFVCKLHFDSFSWVSDIYDIVLNWLGFFNVDNRDKHGVVSLVVSSHDAAYSKRTVVGEEEESSGILVVFQIYLSHYRTRISNSEIHIFLFLVTYLLAEFIASIKSFLNLEKYCIYKKLSQS